MSKANRTYRYRLEVLPEDGEVPVHVYHVESSKRIRKDLLTLAGLLLDDGLMTLEEVAEELPAAQSYVSVEETYVSEEETPL